MRAFPAAIAIAAVLAAVWWLVDIVGDRRELQSELRSTRADLAGARAALASAEEAARVHRAYLDRAEREREQWEALARDLQDMEGRDAPLSPLLGATAERLFGR